MNPNHGWHPYVTATDLTQLPNFWDLQSNWVFIINQGGPNFWTIGYPGSLIPRLLNSSWVCWVRVYLAAEYGYCMDIWSRMERISIPTLQLRLSGLVVQFTRCYHHDGPCEIRLGTNLIRGTRKQTYLLWPGTAIIKLRIGWVPFYRSTIDVQQFLFSHDELVVMNDEIPLHMYRKKSHQGEEKIKHISWDRELR